jgi:hypothetical protein
MNRTNCSYLNFTLSHIFSLRDRAITTTPDEAASARALNDAVGICRSTAEQFGIDLSYEHPNWEEVPDDVFERYVRTVFDTIRRTAADAQHDAQIVSGDEDVWDSYSSTLRSVLSIMQTHARSLGLPRETVDLDGYDSRGLGPASLAAYRTTGTRT